MDTILRLITWEDYVILHSNFFVNYECLFATSQNGGISVYFIAIYLQSFLKKLVHHQHYHSILIAQKYLFQFVNQSIITI